MLNYRVEPELLAPLVPRGVEMDFFQSETYISIAGLLFLDTRVLTIAFPCHRDFEEVNLRFYVRRRSADTWRRGVCFVREIVPKKAVSLLAQLFYGERYMALPMKHYVEHRDRAVDESGYQVSIFNRVGARPMTLQEMQRLYLRDGRLYAVDEKPATPPTKR